MPLKIPGLGIWLSRISTRQMVSVLCASLRLVRKYLAYYELIVFWVGIAFTSTAVLYSTAIPLEARVFAR